MDLCLLAAGDSSSWFSFVWVKVAIGLGFVIFVHELGHFLVAKLCGVKCEKFYIGFDIPIKIGPIRFPSRLARFQWGETEYGIGILPLGGYVKMLGQDDDPRNAQHEADRIRVRKEDAAGTESEPTSQETYELDPRSFPAKPVPYRMAIISAGVVMNLLFAVLFAAYAFRAGVPITPTEIGGTIPGSPAWKAGLEPGSRIIQIGPNGRRSEKLRFDWDLSNSGVGLAQDQEDLPLLVRKPDGEEEWYQIRPVMTQKTKARIPMIGISTAKTLKLDDPSPAFAHQSAHHAQPPFQENDEIIAVAGTPVASALEFDRLLAANPTGDLTFTVRRKQQDSSEEIDIRVPPNPIKTLGLVMEHGPITGIHPGSPAERAGFQEGDLLEAVNGHPFGDPMTFPSELRQYYGQPISVTVRRGGATVDLEVVPEQPATWDWMVGAGFPMGVEALGIAYTVTRTVREVTPGGPADGSGIKPGDTLQGVSFRTEDPEDPLKDLMRDGKEVELTDDGFDWMFVFDTIQVLGPSAVVTLQYGIGEDQTAEIRPVASSVFQPRRGVPLKIRQEIHTAETWTTALALGARQTFEDAQRVMTFLQKLVTGGLSPMNLGGPVSIFMVAGSEASQGLPSLLIFLTFLSANLAVLNFLPIPALDGGHMLFLVAEGVRGKPVDERTQIALTLAGVACLLSLMIFVFGLDFHRFFVR